MSKQHTLDEWVVILGKMERDLLGNEFMTSSIKSLIEIQNEVNFIKEIDITPLYKNRWFKTFTTSIYTLP